MFRDFIYLDTDRVQSVIAQLQEGLLEQVIKGGTKETSGDVGLTASLISMLLPVGFSASVGRSNASSLEQSKVLHDYAFDMALASLREQGYLIEDDLHPVPESGFVLVEGSARIFDYETLNNAAENWDALEAFFDPPASGAAKKNRKKDPKNKIIKESKTVLDTFFKDAIRVRITGARGSDFIGPLARVHLREDIQSLIFKHGSRPRGEWTMLAEITRPPPLTQEEMTPEDLMQGLIGEAETAPREDVQEEMSDVFNDVVDMMNAFQEFIGSPSPSDVAVSPVAIYREIAPR